MNIMYMRERKTQRRHKVGRKEETMRRRERDRRRIDFTLVLLYYLIAAWVQLG